MRLLASHVAHAVGGSLVGPDVDVVGASQDSRDVTPGALFVPIVAERDGHQFIPAAIAAGAAAYLSARGHRGHTAVLVDDTGEALCRLGAAVRARLPDRVIGITGSVGKTSTKDLVGAVLGMSWKTHASEKSFNNEIGVPLTLCNAPDGTDAVVVEMGARGPGQIMSLCAIARPTIGVVTTVGAAHLELFGSVEDVADAKAELVAALPLDGAAVLNADDPLVAAMAKRTRAQVITYGDAGELRAENVCLERDLTTRFVLSGPWGRVDVHLGVRGVHNVPNALAAAAAGLVAGVPLDAVASGLHSARLSPWRMELIDAPSGAAVLNDAYNANPISMRAALYALAAIPAQRHIAVLGVMAELGDSTDDAHHGVGELARKLGVRVIAVGVSTYGGEVVADVSGALAALDSIGEGDAVLVKGSRVAGLEHLAARLVGCVP
jgi:UDP-N-acetylmuramoyl-tripeptide--D-alanyl-D-alanine ligase